MQPVATAAGFVRAKGIEFEKAVFWCFTGLFLTMPLGTSPPLLFGALAVLLWLVSGMAFRVKFLFRERWFWPVLALIVLPWIGLLYSPDPAGFGLKYAGKTYYWVFCLALASLSFENLPTRWLINAFLLGLALNACVGILQLAEVIDPRQGWFTGLTRDYNTLSAYLVLGILVCAFNLREAREQRMGMAMGALMALYFFHLIILEGRTGYLTFIVLFPLVLKTVFRKLGVWKVVAVCLLIIGAMFLSPVVQKRVDLTVSQMKYHMDADPAKAWGREYTAHQDRFYMWKGALEIFLEAPFFGVGTGGYPVTLKEKREPGDPVIAHPHNSILQMAVSHGLIGIAAFVWFFWEVLKNALKQRNTPVGNFVLSSGLVVLVSGLFNSSILDAGTVLLMSLATGLQRAFPALETGAIRNHSSERAGD